MATSIVDVLTVRRTIVSAVRNRTKAVAMTITPEAGGSHLSIPYAPQDVTHNDLGATYVSVTRTGLTD